MKFVYQGKTFKNCGPSSAQTSALAEDTALGNQLRSAYTEDFGETQTLFDELHSNLSTIVAAGPSQQGESPDELAAENSQAINGAAASNKATQAAIGEKEGAVDTANPGVESGVTTAVRAKAASDVETNLSNQELGITEKNYQIGRQNYENAVSAEEGLPSAVIDPVTGTAKAAIGADQTTDEQSNANASASNSWLGLVSGIAGGAVRGLMSKTSNGGGGLDPNANPNSAGLFESTTPSSTTLTDAEANNLDWLPGVPE